MKYWIILALPIVLTSCVEEETEKERRARLADEEILAYLEENDIEAERSSTGIHFEVVEENENGDLIRENDIVSVVYRMDLISGFKVEIHSDTMNPVKFSHSSNALIPAGLNEEIGRMREGERFRFYIPSYQAYGDYNHKGLFSAYSNFILDITVTDLQTESQQYELEIDSIKSYLQTHEMDSAEKYSSGLFFLTVEEGAGIRPKNGDLIELHFTRKYLDGSVIETTVGEEPIVVTLGQNRLVEGFAEGVRLMRKGGEAILIMPSELAFGKSIQVIPQRVRFDWENDRDIEPETRPYSPVLYEVELLDVN